MTAFLIRRLLIAIPTLLAVIVITFSLMRLTPGSPFSSERKLDPKVEARMMERFNLDGSLPEQLGRYLVNLSRGDLGDSTQFRNRTVLEIIEQTLPRSMLLGACSLLLALGLGVALGTTAAVHHHGWKDRAAMMAALVGICLPSFLLAPLMILFFAIIFPVFPVAGWGTVSHLILPVICLSLPYAAYSARLMRTSMLEVLNQDYVRTARAKGLAEKMVIYKHALKIGILPLISYAGPLAANILTGSLVVEEIFKIPGVGAFFVNGVLNRDVFLVGGIVIVYSSLLILMNLLADVVLALLDRRVRLW
jgi:ABC-type dipeptide/oligopeptide/nickel transport system permease component